MIYLPDAPNEGDEKTKEKTEKSKKNRRIYSR